MHITMALQHLVQRGLRVCASPACACSINRLYSNGSGPAEMRQSTNRGIEVIKTNLGLQRLKVPLETQPSSLQGTGEQHAAHVSEQPSAPAARCKYDAESLRVISKFVGCLTKDGKKGVAQVCAVLGRLD